MLNSWKHPISKTNQICSTKPKSFKSRDKNVVNALLITESTAHKL